MKIKKIAIIFMMLVLTVISFMNTSKADETIYVKILKAELEEEGIAVFSSLTFQEPFEVLNNYTWYVNNTNYSFSAEIVELPTELLTDNKSYLQYNLNENNLLIMDGGSCDQYQCVFDYKLKDAYRNYIEDGGGFIGRCGGSIFPLRLNEEPETLTQLGVDSAAFLKEEMSTSQIYNIGWPVITEYFKIKPGIIFKDRPTLRPRLFNDPTALGWGAYTYYNQLPMIGSIIGSKNNQSQMTGECDHLDNLDKKHPILKDYYGDTLFFRNGGGCAFEISNEENWVKPLATYPQDSYENRKLNVFMLGHLLVGQSQH